MLSRKGGTLTQWAYRWATRRAKLLPILALLTLLLTAEGPPPGELSFRVDRLLTGQHFDFVGWEVGAVLGKLGHAFIAPQRYMDDQARVQFVRDYFTLVGEIQRLDYEINRAYVDPDVTDPDAATKEQRARLAQLRREEDARQPLAEAILEELIAAVLADEGFGVLGQVIPPVGIRFTSLPFQLVISPRERIESVHQASLRHGLGVDEREAIEEQVDTTFDVSSLAVPIGGLAAYPAMMIESSWLPWAVEAGAHEWAHHYLTPYPLGWSYEESGEARTINETVASIAGRELGRRTLARYYLDLVTKPRKEREEEPGEPPAFDFRAEMRQTRVEVDRLLAAGEVERAESYMEMRRRVFVEHGYPIRKLNQAYFAFHGAYADQPGAAGEDPIGPAVWALRIGSPNLRTFLRHAAGVTTLAELEALLAEARR